jgi:hypothetical protein
MSISRPIRFNHANVIARRLLCAETALHAGAAIAVILNIGPISPVLPR